MARPDTPLPGWVREANRRLTTRLGRSRVIRSQEPPQAGELRLAEPLDTGSGEPRIVCVVEVDPGLTTLRAALVSNEVDVATVSDVTLPRDVTGLPFDLMVEADVTGWLWWFQAEGLIGRLDERTNGLVSAAVGRGVVVSPTSGSRSREHGRMDELSSHCEAACATGGRTVPLVVDPILAQAKPSDDGPTYAARMTALAAEIASSRRPVLPDGVAGAILAAWDRGLRIPPDAWRGLQPLLDRSLAEPVPEPTNDLVFEPRRRRGVAWADRSLAESCARQLALGERVVRLLTTPRTWTGSGRRADRVATARTGGGDRLQLIRQHLEVHL